MGSSFGHILHLSFYVCVNENQHTNKAVWTFHRRTVPALLSLTEEQSVDMQQLMYLFSSGKPELLDHRVSLA